MRKIFSLIFTVENEKRMQKYAKNNFLMLNTKKFITLSFNMRDFAPFYFFLTEKQKKRIYECVCV